MDGIIVILKSLAWNGNLPYLKVTKTKNTWTLDMPARTIDGLRDHRKQSIEERLLVGIGGRKSGQTWYSARKLGHH